MDIDEYNKEGYSLVPIGENTEDTHGSTMAEFKYGIERHDVILEHVQYITWVELQSTILATQWLNGINVVYVVFRKDTGDHRHIFIAINISSVLGSDLLPATTGPARKLKYQDPQAIKIQYRI